MTRLTRALARLASALAVPFTASLDAQDTSRAASRDSARNTGRPGRGAPTVTPRLSRAAAAAAAESSATAARALGSLDTWIVLHFRGAALLPAGEPRDSTARAEALPRVESVRPGRSADTLYALHFGPNTGPPAVRPGATVRLVGPTGTRTDITTRVLAHREFRAPAAPALTARTRFAWGYLVVIPRPAGATTGALAYRGWLLAPVETR